VSPADGMRSHKHNNAWPSSA